MRGGKSHRRYKVQVCVCVCVLGFQSSTVSGAVWERSSMIAVHLGGAEQNVCPQEGALKY